MKNSILLSLLFFCFLFTSCDDDDGLCTRGQGSTVTETLVVANFTDFDLKIDADIVVTQGPTQEVRVTGQGNIIDRLETNVIGNTWSIDLNGTCFNYDNMTIFITTPNIGEVRLSGSGNIDIGAFDNQSIVDLRITGSGEIAFDRFTSLVQLHAEITGSGDISAIQDATQVEQLDITIRGSGNFFGFPIQSELCNVEITGSGNCQVQATDKLDVTIRGSGDVAYQGQPMINQDVTGSGRLRDAN